MIEGFSLFDEVYKVIYP